MRTRAWRTSGHRRAVGEREKVMWEGVGRVQRRNIGEMYVICSPRTRERGRLNNDRKSGRRRRRGEEAE